jgi:ABC-type phosphate transport system auxiliary subunit
MKRLIVFYLMFCVGVVPALPIDTSKVVPEEDQNDSQQKSDKDVKREAEIKAKVELLRLGAEVKVAMRGAYTKGKLTTHRGTIAEISDECLGLQVGDRTLQIDYDQIEELSLTKNKYKASGQVDPVAVRRVVADVGMGEKAKLKLDSDKKISGVIQSVASDSFTIADSKTGQTETVLFSEVTEIQKDKMSTGARVAIIAGVVAGILFGIFLAIPKG